MKKKVILVQDNKEILEIMDEVLEDEGFDVTASLTTEPIDRIEEIKPDAIVVDDHIKGKKKGSTVIKEVKESIKTEHVSAILTSTSAQLPDQAKECKADDYIQKPFELDDMINVIKRNTN